MRSTEAALHKARLYRLLIAIADSGTLAQHIAFKGGTCAAMLGYLDRFSVDLDFDFTGNLNKKKARKILHRIFNVLDFEVKDESASALQFFLKYTAPAGYRNTLKLEILDKVFRNNHYKPQYLRDIDRMLVCQTIDTMFANKLVAMMERYEKTGNIAGRDLYDIRNFFMGDYSYNPLLVEERRKIPVQKYFRQLSKFLEKRITQKIIDQDLNTLLPLEKFKKIRITLLTDVQLFLKEEIKHL